MFSCLLSLWIPVPVSAHWPVYGCRWKAVNWHWLEHFHRTPAELWLPCSQRAARRAPEQCGWKVQLRAWMLIELIYTSISWRETGGLLLPTRSWESCVFSRLRKSKRCVVLTWPRLCSYNSTQVGPDLIRTWRLCFKLCLKLNNPALDACASVMFQKFSKIFLISKESVWNLFCGHSPWSRAVLSSDLSCLVLFIHVFMLSCLELAWIIFIW